MQDISEYIIIQIGFNTGIKLRLLSACTVLNKRSMHKSLENITSIVIQVIKKIKDKMALKLFTRNFYFKYLFIIEIIQF